MQFEAIKKYETSPLVGKMNWQLPMNEFVQGNFSNADSIKKLFQNLLQQCFEESMKEYTKRDDGSWNLYRKEKLEKLELERNILTWEYNALNEKITLLQNEKKSLLNPIKEKYSDSKWWIELCTIINKALDTYPALEEIRDITKEPWKQRILDIRMQIEEIIEKNKVIYPLDQERAKIKHNLDHKGNRHSVVAQMNDFYDWTEARQLRYHISHKVKEVLSGSRFNHEDIVDISKYYNEVLWTELCKHSFLDTNTCKKILRTHTDKVWVFEYFYNLYSIWSWTMRSIHEFENKESATQVVIEKLHTYNKILKDIHHWSTQISQDDIDFIEKILLSKKKWPRYRRDSENERLRSIFRFIAELDLEWRPWDFEKTIEAIRNADYYNYFQNTWKFFELLVFLYTVMNKEEKKQIHEWYDSYMSFNTIYDLYKEEKKWHESKQWILFAFTDDDNRNHRIRVLQEQIHNGSQMPDTLWEEEYKAIETLVFAQRKTRLPLKYKKKQFATIENRRKNRQHKQAVWMNYLEILFEQEMMWRKSFPRAVRTLQPHIIRNKEPLYSQFPILESTSIEA